jgi:hypothetical protein
MRFHDYSSEALISNGVAAIYVDDAADNFIVSSSSIAIVATQ